MRTIHLQNVYANGGCVSNSQAGNYSTDPGAANANRIQRGIDGSRRP